MLAFTHLQLTCGLAAANGAVMLRPTRATQTADLLRDKIRDRALAAGANFRFKDAIAPFVGHAVCSSTERLTGLSNPIGESYHPIRTGHSSGYALLVRSVMG